MSRAPLKYVSSSSPPPFLGLSTAAFPLTPHCPLTHIPQATIGSVTGNQAWATSGEQDKNQAIDAMKAASENRDSSSQGLGSVEETAGKLVGCEGMQKEGAESKRE